MALDGLETKGDLKRFLHRELKESPNLLRPPGAIEAWTVVSTFSNSWAAFGSDRPPPRYYKDPYGVVHLSGSMKDGTVDATAFTLPVGYRPAYRHRFATDENGTAGVINVSSDGGVNAVGGTNTERTLNGISFRTD